MAVNKIDREPVTVTWTESGTVAIGRYTCDWCGTETPTPTTAVIIEFVKATNASTLWPFQRFSGTPVFEPPGWSQRGDEVLCDLCTPAFERAVADVKRRRIVESR